MTSLIFCAYDMCCNYKDPRFRLFFDRSSCCVEAAKRHLELITKTYLYNFDPLKPHFYIVKNLGLQGYTFFFLFQLKSIDCGYSLEPPHQGGSNEHPQSIFWAEIWTISYFFIWKLWVFFGVKFSIYLNRSVFLVRSTHVSRSVRKNIFSDVRPTKGQISLRIRSLINVFVVWWRSFAS